LGQKPFYKGLAPDEMGDYGNGIACVNDTPVFASPAILGVLIGQRQSTLPSGQRRHEREDPSLPLSQKPI